MNTIETKLVAALRTHRTGRGAFLEAENAYRRILAEEPENADGLHMLGVLLHQTGRMSEGVALIRQAIAVNPRVAIFHYNLGNALYAFKQFENAADSFRDAVAANPRYYEALNNLGNALWEIGETQEAATVFERALTLNPAYVPAYCNLGRALREQGRVDEAIAILQRVIQHDPDYAEAHLNLAEARLTRGDFEQAWAEYEWRGRAYPWLWRPESCPRWDGSQAAGKTILISSDQTLGSEILFASVLPELTARGARCILECDPRMVPIFRRSMDGVDACSSSDLRDPSGNVQMQGIDAHLPLGSLPQLFRRNDQAFSSQPAFLKSDDMARSVWRRRLSKLDSDFTVGVSWRGGGTQRERVKRTVPLERWGDILSMPGVTPISIQYGDVGAEIEQCRQQHGMAIHVFDDLDVRDDLDGLAALISALDLVISIDNATAHLAAALGVPTWNLLPAGADCRWMLDRSDSPWFPSMQLFRQSEPGDWSSVLQDVASRLRRLASTPASLLAAA